MPCRAVSLLERKASLAGCLLLLAGLARAGPPLAPQKRADPWGAREQCLCQGEEGLFLCSPWQCLAFPLLLDC